MSPKLASAHYARMKFFIRQNDAVLAPCPNSEQALRADLKEDHDDHEHDHLGQRRGGVVLDERVQEPECERRDDRALDLAEAADHVALVAAGLPLVLKGQA